MLTQLFISHNNVGSDDRFFDACLSVKRRLLKITPNKNQRQSENIHIYPHLEMENHLQLQIEQLLTGKLWQF